MVHNEYNFGAFEKKRGIAPTYSWGIGSADEFSVGAYYLDVHGRPLYNHPWFLSSKGTIIPTLSARNYYGLASDYLDTSAQYVSFSHTHRFEDEGFNADVARCKRACAMAATSTTSGPARSASRRARRSPTSTPTPSSTARPKAAWASAN